MRFLDVGSEPVGIIAIGQNATGVIAIGQLATGVVAVGQLARGVFVLGQLAVGVAAFGQAAVALTYGGGMLGLVGLRTSPSLLVLGVAGEGHLWRNGRFGSTARLYRTSRGLTAVRVIAMLLVIGAVVWIALSWLPDYIDDEPDEPPPTTFEPGTR